MAMTRCSIPGPVFERFLIDCDFPRSISSNSLSGSIILCCSAGTDDVVVTRFERRQALLLGCVCHLSKALHFQLSAGKAGGQRIIVEGVTTSAFAPRHNFSFHAEQFSEIDRKEEVHLKVW